MIKALPLPHHDATSSVNPSLSLSPESSLCLAPPTTRGRVPSATARTCAAEPVGSDFDPAAFMRAKIAADSLEEAFFVLDLGVVARKVGEWRQHLGRISPACAVKCNSNPAFLRTVAALGVLLDCTSRAEVDAALAAGASSNSLLFSSPCKLVTQLRAVAGAGVTTLAFDCEADLAKIAKAHPRAELLLRVAAPDAPATQLQRNPKGGAAPGDAPALLAAAAALGLSVVGVSFDLGCIATAPNHIVVLETALQTARKIMDGAAAAGQPMSILDLGGGFPGLPSTLALREIAAGLLPALEAYIPASVRVVADIGRFIAGPAMTLAVNVFARRDISAGRNSSEEPRDAGAVDFLYYVSDGVYGSFSCMIFDNAVVTPKPLMVRDSKAAARTCTVFGPTCDGIDFIAKQTVLPELHIGDWLCFENMGAYTLAEATAFNGFGTTLVYVVDSSARV
eukprot:TRINITY_DN2646_c0_g1_i1.p1 TRINITY_DN2646_c0_g1~~TRINITY_DN2646_c0_g1_i1.p1  ORF type:complete len:451 (+),score=124.54 TRINITY_DN2646_c0_g1_i1:335-1687(+)